MKHLNKLSRQIKHTVVNGEHFFTLTEKDKDIATGVLKMRPGNSAEITSLVVWNEGERNKGHGRRIVTDMISFCKTERRKEIKVKSSPEAVGFYEKLNFSENDKGFLVLQLDH